ncbi:MAG: hypothetical protein DHS20C11_35950 [Lysobacteraceae bacterium]|nr:MAG: hypothetical protein DHS20C11_35950 [Xanthomonadaceae bacterium]
MKPTAEIKQSIIENAEEIRRLHARIDETFALRKTGEKAHESWQAACREFHQRYDSLAFPGGFEGAYQRILNGERNAIEAGLCFLEVRPYFFRSGYMYKDLVRKLKRAPLTPAQQSRFDQFLLALQRWKDSKRNTDPD